MIDQKQLEELKDKARAAEPHSRDWGKEKWEDFQYCVNPAVILSLIAELEQARKEVGINPRCDERGGIVSQSEDLFNRADETEAIKILARQMCESHEEKSLGGVHYDIFAFSDRSKLTWGDNGFVGSETPKDAIRSAMKETGS